MLYTIQLDKLEEANREDFIARLRTIPQVSSVTDERKEEGLRLQAESRARIEADNARYAATGVYIPMVEGVRPPLPNRIRVEANNSNPKVSAELAKLTNNLPGTDGYDLVSLIPFFNAISNTTRVGNMKVSIRLSEPVSNKEATIARFRSIPQVVAVVDNGAVQEAEAAAWRNGDRTSPRTINEDGFQRSEHLTIEVNNSNPAVSTAFANLVRATNTTAFRGYDEALLTSFFNSPALHQNDIQSAESYFDTLSLSTLPPWAYGLIALGGTLAVIGVGYGIYYVVTKE